MRSKRESVTVALHPATIRALQSSFDEGTSLETCVMGGILATLEGARTRKGTVRRNIPLPALKAMLETHDLTYANFEPKEE